MNWKEKKKIWSCYDCRRCNSITVCTCIHKYGSPHLFCWDKKDNNAPPQSLLRHNAIWFWKTLPELELFRKWNVSNWPETPEISYTHTRTHEGSDASLRFHWAQLRHGGRNQEMLMCVMCSLGVCIPGEIMELKPERGMSHVQWITASHTEAEGRRMQKYTTTTHH